MSEFLGEIHPLAARWPMMPDDELAALAESIAADGLSHPLVLDGQGRLVDGRNRLEACRIARVHPKYLSPRGLDTDEEIRAYIGRVNAQRRNVSTGQKAIAVADDLAAQGKRKNGRWERGSITQESGLSGVAWTEAMRLAGLIIDHRPDLTDQVIAGDLTLNAAAEQAEAARDVAVRAEAAEKRRIAQLADLAENRPDLAALVESGQLPLKDALAARDQETAAERKAAEDKAAAIRQRNVDVQAALACLSTLGHPEIRDEVLAHWYPLAHNWTADEVANLGHLLIDLSEYWRRVVAA